MRILIIDDEPPVVAGIKQRLRRDYIVDAAYNGKTGTYLAEVCDYDLILLDLCLPDLDGREVCRAIRDNRVLTPILALTGEIGLVDKVTTLDAGADDYLTKPFDFAELQARIRALLRRTAASQRSNEIQIDDLCLDPIKRQVRRGDIIVQLRRKDFDLLEYLIRHRGTVIDRQTIMEHVWDDESNSTSNIVDVHIKHLRDRIDRPFRKRLIRTVHGIGYKIEAQP